MLGMFAFNMQGVEGAIYQMLNHGISTGSLFLIVGMVYERRHTRLIADFGGLSKVMPIYAVFFMIVTLSSIGLPGTNGFVGEFLILLGAFQCRLWGVGRYRCRLGSCLYAVDVSKGDVWENHTS
jgi:NADH-quinone oxidoreductase subunit M